MVLQSICRQTAVSKQNCLLAAILMDSWSGKEQTYASKVESQYIKFHMSFIIMHKSFQEGSWLLLPGNAVLPETTKTKQIHTQLQTETDVSVCQLKLNSRAFRTENCGYFTKYKLNWTDFNKKTFDTHLVQGEGTPNNSTELWQCSEHYRQFQQINTA